MPGVILGMKSKSDVSLCQWLSSLLHVCSDSVPLLPTTHIPPQVAHHEFIAILGQLARSFKDHPRFKELAVLTDPDPEADFFENMRHIQVLWYILTRPVGWACSRQSGKSAIC